MTPGAFIRRFREALWLSLDDVAARLASEPPYASEMARREQLALVEADIAPLTPDLADALATLAFAEMDRWAQLLGQSRPLVSPTLTAAHHADAQGGQS